MGGRCTFLSLSRSVMEFLSELWRSSSALECEMEQAIVGVHRRGAVSGKSLALHPNDFGPATVGITKHRRYALAGHA